MISNGKDRPISELGELPDPSAGMRSWFQRLRLVRITKTLENYRITEGREQIETLGVVQPMSSESLNMKPEGQRSWAWITIHCLPRPALALDDIVEHRGVEYRVLDRFDWSQYGYVEYHACQEYTK